MQEFERKGEASAGGDKGFDDWERKRGYKLWERDGGDEFQGGWLEAREKEAEGGSERAEENGGRKGRQD